MNEIVSLFFSSKTHDQWRKTPTLREYISLRNVGRGIFGIGGEVNEQVLVGYGDRMFLDFILLKEWKHVVEFGTWTGLTSLYLGISAVLNGWTFITYDFKDYRLPEVKSIWHPVMEFELVNLLGVEPEKDNRPVKNVSEEWEPVSSVVKRVSRQRVLLIVDNGSKKDEVRLYCSHLQSKSGFLVHDWGEEVCMEDIQEIMEQNGFRLMYNEVAELLGTHFRFFEKA